MQCRSIEIKRIMNKGPDADRYLFSFRPDLDDLVSSIREEGLISPLILRERDNGELQVVCGFQRIQALQRLDVKHADAILLSGQSWPDGRCLRRSLLENLWNRGFNPVEKALLFTRLHDDFPERIPSLEDVFQGDLKIPVNPPSLEPHRFILTLPEPMLHSLARGTLSMGQAQLIRPFSDGTRLFLVRVMEACSLTLQESRQVAEWFQDRLGQDILMEKPGMGPGSVERLLTETLSPRKRAEKLLTLFRRMRYPMWESLKERFHEAKKGLGLPDRDIRISHDPTFETTEIRVQILAGSCNDFQAKIDLLSRASQEGKVRKIFDVLDPGSIHSGPNIYDV